MKHGITIAVLILSLTTPLLSSWRTLLYGPLYEVVVVWSGASSDEGQVIAHTLLKELDCIPRRSIAEDGLFTVYFHSRLDRYGLKELLWESTTLPEDCEIVQVERLTGGLPEKPVITTVEELQVRCKAEALQKYSLTVPEVAQIVRAAEQPSDTTLLQNTPVQLNHGKEIRLGELVNLITVERESHRITEY